MSKVKKLDSPGYRGKARECPSCDGQELVGKYRHRKVCETCFGSGVVYQGTFCPFCGRSPQLEHRGYLICGSEFCKGEADKKLSIGKPINVDNYYKDGYDDMFGLFSH